MNARIQKWGNSQGLRVSKPLLEAAHFMVGEEVVLLAEEGQITIKAARKPKVTIQSLAARMPKNYKPFEESSGPPRGKEVW